VAETVKLPKIGSKLRLIVLKCQNKNVKGHLCKMLDDIKKIILGSSVLHQAPKCTKQTNKPLAFYYHVPLFGYLFPCLVTNLYVILIMKPV